MDAAISFVIGLMVLAIVCFVGLMVGFSIMFAIAAMLLSSPLGWLLVIIAIALVMGKTLDSFTAGFRRGVNSLFGHS